MTMLAAILGVSGPRLLDTEKAFFRDVNPWGCILFARNIETPDQVRRLTSDIRESVGRECLIFIDQEGGRVQRLRPPHWPNYHSAERVSRSYVYNQAATKRAVYLHHRLIADDLRSVGINADCAPVLDIPLPDADPIISDRAFGLTPAQIIDLGQAAIEGLKDGGVAPVIKHIPGHGRALVDSHLELPRVDTSLEDLKATDFAPFKGLADAPMAMTAHVVYEAVDAKEPVTLSQKAITSIIRDHMEYDGLLMTDDLDMKALPDDLVRSTVVALASGCDIALQCSGKLDAMVSVAKGGKTLMETALKRAKRAEKFAREVKDFDRQEALEEYAYLVPEDVAIT